MNEIEKILEGLRQQTAENTNNIYPGTLAMNDFDLPIVIERDQDYFQSLKSVLSNYVNYLKSIKKLPSTVMENAQSNIKIIMNAMNFFYMGRTLDGISQMTMLLNRYKDNEFIVSELDKSYGVRGMSYFDTKWDMTENKLNAIKNTELSFFKARLRDGDHTYTRADMLHIPFHKRAMVQEHRYSLPGIPCMYLGVSSYTCWVELDRPKLENMVISSYKLPKNFRVLNLALGEGLINGTSSRCQMTGKERDQQYLNTLLELWPLLCATSYQVREEDRVFKSERIIPQFVMMSLKAIGVHGLIYCSNKIAYSSYRFPNCVNIALPAYEYLDEAFEQTTDYSVKARKILLTTPILAADVLESNEIASQLSYYNTSFYDRDKEYVKLTIEDKQAYTYQDFYKIDNLLVSMEHERAFSEPADIEDEI